MVTKSVFKFHQNIKNIDFFFFVVIFPIDFAKGKRPNQVWFVFGNTEKQILLK